MQLKIMSKKEIKSILLLIRKQWDAEILLDYVFLMNKKGRIYVSNKDIFDLDETKLRIDAIGLYFGKLEKSGLRLSIEGSQIIGPKAQKGVITLDDSELSMYIHGEEIDISDKTEGFCLVKHNNDFYGTAKIKQGTLLNYYPKTRRI